MMRQVYNVESPPSSMLFDTSSLLDAATDVIVDEDVEQLPINAECSKFSYTFMNLTLSSYYSHPSKAVSQHTSSNPKQNSQDPTTATASVSTMSSPLRLRMANLMPSRLALNLTRFLFDFYCLYLNVWACL